jgi:predicted dehydrogenase
MHLHYLRELTEKFEVVALCDLSPETLAFAARAHPEARTFTRWEDLIEERLDVVLVLIAEAMLRRRSPQPRPDRRVRREADVPVGRRGRDDRCVERSGTRLMVGYMKRYDPAYEELATWIPSHDIRLRASDDARVAARAVRGALRARSGDDRP